MRTDLEPRPPAALDERRARAPGAQLGPGPPLGRGIPAVGRCQAWQRPDIRVASAATTWAALLLFASVMVMWWRETPLWLHLSVSVCSLAVVGYEALRCATTSYRLTGDQIELRTGVLMRTHRSIARSQVRWVDVTANPMHQLFGIATVRVVTTSIARPHDEITVDALSTEVANRLRRALTPRADRW